MTDYSDYSDYDDEATAEMSIIAEIPSGSEEINEIIAAINGNIKQLHLPDFFDESFITSLIESDITSNIRFFKIGSIDHAKTMIQLDALNNLYIPLEVFINMIVPTYLTTQLRTSFSGLTSIRDILNEMAYILQNEIERITIAVSEEEYKDAKFNKKNLSADELSSKLLSYTTETISTSQPLDECPICSDEHIKHYYECKKCQYKYCKSCCEEIASRQALCPCCRENMELIEHTVT